MIDNTSPRTSGPPPNIEFPTELGNIDFSDILGEGPDGRDGPGINASARSPQTIADAARKTATDPLTCPEQLERLGRSYSRALFADAGVLAYFEADRHATEAQLATLEADYSKSQADRVHARAMKHLAPFGPEQFTEQVERIIGLITMVNRTHSESLEARRTYRAVNRVTMRVTRSTRTGRSARMASNTRSAGSRRTVATASSGGGSGGDSDLSDQSDPPGSPARSVPNDSAPLETPRACLGCGRPLDPGRRADATLCPEPDKWACRHLLTKRGPAKPWSVSAATIRGLRAACIAENRAAPAFPLDLNSPSDRDLADAARTEAEACWDSPTHPADFDALTRKVRRVLKTRDKATAAHLLREWFARVDIDPDTGIASCRSCRYLVPTPDAGVNGLTRLFGTWTDTRFEMTTDGHGQPLNWRPGGGRTEVAA